MVSFISDRVRPALLLAASALCLQSCIHDVSSDGTPPDYTIPNLAKSQGKWRYGVTDTIAVQFSKNIDTGAFSVSFDPADGIARKFDGPSRLLVFGSLKGPGATHFPVRSPFTATFKGVSDVMGNGRPAATETFEPYYWADRDFVDSAFDGEDSLFASDSTWADGSPFSDTLVSEGVLDAKTNRRSVDYNDIKLIKLVPPDTFRVTLTGPKTVNLKLQIAGPFLPAKADSILGDYDFDQAKIADSTQSRGTASALLLADYKVHDDSLGSPSQPGIYAVRVSLGLDKEAFYRMQTVLHRKKRP
jgi:hypothetical protein